MPPTAVALKSGAGSPILSSVVMFVSGQGVTANGPPQSTSHSGSPEAVRMLREGGGYGRFTTLLNTIALRCGSSISLESKKRLPDYVAEEPANIGLRSQLQAAACEFDPPRWQRLSNSHSSNPRAIIQM